MPAHWATIEQSIAVSLRRSGSLARSRVVGGGLGRCGWGEGEQEGSGWRGHNSWAWAAPPWQRQGHRQMQTRARAQGLFVRLVW